MYVTNAVKVQLAMFTVIAPSRGAVMVFGYIKVPAMLGAGRYTVTVELPGGRPVPDRQRHLPRHRGRPGRVVQLTDTGVQAKLSLKSGIAIPSDLDAEVHSQSAIGEQYVALLPRDGDSRH